MPLDSSSPKYSEEQKEELFSVLGHDGVDEFVVDVHVVVGQRRNAQP
ncbi:hypothetical protein [Mycolicibacterium sp. CH28]|nr:hypothetical protein [Mycolicibacterium sp. CH28]